MRTLILTRGDDEFRKPVVSELQRLLNPDVNHVQGYFIEYSSYDYLNDKKAAYASVKKELKVAINNHKYHIVIDAESPGLQSWDGFASAVADTGIFIIGLDCGEEPIRFSPPGGHIMYQNVKDIHVEDILKKNHIL